MAAYELSVQPNWKSAGTTAHQASKTQPLRLGILLPNLASFGMSVSLAMKGLMDKMNNQEVAM
jgi:hypothetical protein